MASNDLELVANFCNNSQDPLLFTLPIKFCDHDFICEGVLRHLAVITIMSVGAVIVVFSLLLLTWHATMHHIAGKFISLSENERMEYMLKIAGEVHRRQELEWKLKREVERRTGTPDHMVTGKEASSEGSSFVTF
jgi:type IV secretory pathway VirB3-like protein